MNQQINIGCNGIIIKNDKILLGLRKNCYGDGTYGLPGGHLELGERMQNAVKRELKEELSIEAEELQFNSMIDQGAADQPYIQVNFIVNKFKGEISCLEPERCGGWKWFDLKDLPENIFPLHIPIIEAYQNKEMYC